jgi:hypothetical protein
MADRVEQLTDQWPAPEPITDAPKTGERLLVWWNEGRGWVIGWYSDGQWRVTHDPRQWINGVTHYLQLPPDLNPAPQRE